MCMGSHFSFPKRPSSGGLKWVDELIMKGSSAEFLGSSSWYKPASRTWQQCFVFSWEPVSWASVKNNNFHWHFHGRRRHLGRGGHAVLVLRSDVPVAASPLGSDRCEQSG